MSEAVPTIISALQHAGREVKQTGDSYRTSCPAHNGTRIDSLEIRQGASGALIKCHADGCQPEAIMEAIGLPAAGLFDEHWAPKPEIVAEYDYTDEAGDLLYQVVRLSPKGFRQRRPDGQGGWEWRLGDVRRVLYRLPRLAEPDNDVVFVVEGEKDVHAIEQAGGVATCNAGGAGGWRDEYAAALAGKEVYVVADRDEPGRKHAREVADSLDGLARRVSVVEAADGKDAADHLAAGHTLDDFQPAGDAPSTPDKPGPLGHTLSLDFTSPPPPPDWIVERTIARRRVTLIAAESGAGKSKLAWSLVAALILGEDWLGWKVSGSRVLVIDNENPSDDVVSHMWAFGLRNEHREQLRYYCRQGIMLSEAKHRQAALAAVEQFKPDVIVIDTATAVGNVELADNNGITRLYNAVLRPLAEYGDGAAVLLLHHNRKAPASGDQGSRKDQILGGIQWNGQADGTLVIWPAGEDMDVLNHADGTSTRDYPIRLRVEKVRQGIKGLERDVHLWSEHDAEGVMLAMHAEAPDVAEKHRWMCRVEAIVRSEGGDCPPERIAERLRMRDMGGFMRGLASMEREGRIELVDGVVVLGSGMNGGSSGDGGAELHDGGRSTPAGEAGSNPVEAGADR